MDPTSLTIVIVVAALLLIAAKMSVRIVRQYEQGVLFRLGPGASDSAMPGLRFIIPFVDARFRWSAFGS